MTYKPAFLVALLSFAQFLDVFNSSAFFSAIPAISSSLGLSSSSSVWLVSAYQITFSSFLLLSGRLSDVYNPRLVFLLGFGCFCGLSLASGFVRNKIVFLVFRSLVGVAASLTIPSALRIITHIFTDTTTQARAIAAFNSNVAIANILGLLLGAVFVQCANWKWIFFFEAMVAFPVTILCLVFIPKRAESTLAGAPQIKPSNLDWPGVFLITTSLLLFVLAITSGVANGWGSANVIAPLTLSVGLCAGFVYWESRISPSDAAISPQTWFYPNLAVLLAVGLLPMLWWTAVFFAYTTYWQEIYLWSPISVALRLLPIGLLGIVTMAIVVICRFPDGNRL